MKQKIMLIALLCCMCGIMPHAHTMTKANNLEKAKKDLQATYHKYKDYYDDNVNELEQFLIKTYEKLEHAHEIPADLLAWDIVENTANLLPEHFTSRPDDLDMLTNIIIKHCPPKTLAAQRAFTCAMFMAINEWCSTILTRTQTMLPTTSPGSKRKKSTNTPINIAEQTILSQSSTSEIEVYDDIFSHIEASPDAFDGELSD